MTNSKEKSYNILHQAFNKMYIDLKEKIWIPRCKILIEKERKYKISKKVKRSTMNSKIEKKGKKGSKGGVGINIVDRKKLLIDSIDTWQIWIEKEIRFGFLWMDFWSDTGIFSVFSFFQLNC